MSHASTASTKKSQLAQGQLNQDGFQPGWRLDIDTETYKRMLNRTAVTLTVRYDDKARLPWVTHQTQHPG